MNVFSTLQSNMWPHAVNQNGSSIILFLLMMAAVALIVLGAVSTRTIDNANTNKMYKLFESNETLRQQFNIVLSNPLVCASLLTIQNNKFSLGNVLFEGLETTDGVLVSSMDIANINNLGNGQFSADFTMSTVPKNTSLVSALKAISSSVIYTPGGGNTVTSCQLQLDPAQVCATFGTIWIAAQNRCSICESMGGTWAAGACAMP